ncbi:MAG: UDP-N-acetylmuramoyl-L-alanyl-D-glutamate--2,6-diaminopimelate ligase [Deltaproteobacteria bacterium]|nr:UDP-N-acetylmuramoyl-L-alanyl-D-glutamate--2,6-diaminopimelate ligase [Deltaproteobacteria bacterium]
MVEGVLDRPVRGLTHDSRAVVPDGVFVALKGAHHDGHAFVPHLATAAAVVVQDDTPAPPGVTRVRVADTRVALPFLAASYHDHPGRRVPVVGITGTNGKTTVSFLAAAALRGSGWRTGVIGTTGHLVDGQPLDGSLVGLPRRVHPHTTPEAPHLQALLACMAEAGCRAVAMEVSSVGLQARRVDAIPFRVAVFTNLSRDHLDVHETMEAYRTAKARLFHELLPLDGIALLHEADPAWASMRPVGRTVWTYGLQAGDLHLEAPVWSPEGTTAIVRTPAGTGRMRVPLPGRHNVENALAALGVALCLGAPLETSLEGIAATGAVPGRLEPVPNRRGLTVLVDYAHTPDALARVLGALREVSPGRLLVVFGCGGDRDPGKRAPMGRVAAALCDLVVITSDNPRSEDPNAILDAVAAGAAGGSARIRVEPDRVAAIALALSEARPGDVVVVAGKGHETTQEFADRVVEHDDREVARRLLGETS